ncbi:thioredoxin reductase [Glycomyces algeriensis]|uniref:Thioredoxin reductase n=1 Tax=Glycomyces algeriensis TaxID=256037 RepID=A0A9W6LJ20_9ACTN|nr:thioredoxin reductase [Glycomyces algeriensis]
MFEGFQFGGALMQTTEVENYPGFPEGIMGPELMDSWRKQAERFGAELVSDDVTRVDLTGDIKKVWVEDREYQAKAVILATGSAFRPLNVPGENELMGRGVSACATCDGFFFRDQHIAVVGGGDTAMEEATFLTKFAAKVTIVHRRDEFRASKVMAERALANPKIEVAWNSAVTQVNGTDGKVSSVDLVDTVTGTARNLPATGLFIAIGHDPRSELFKGQVELDESGYVKVAAPSTRTNIEGVFAAGDLVDHTYQQAVTAAGTGAAALDAERYLTALEDAAVAGRSEV